MGIFKPSPQESEVEKATSENNMQEDWSLIMGVCDKAGKSTDEAKIYMKAIVRRMTHLNPHVALQAITLLDACINNCGKTFHLEVASSDFETEFTKLLSKCHPKVGQKMKECLKKWAEGEFKNDVQLNLIPSLYAKLRSKGVDFSSEPQAKKTVQLSKDPNVVHTQEEEDAIAKAIELSLRENTGSPRSSSGGGGGGGGGGTTTSSSLYPSTNLGAASLSSNSTTPQKESRKVRALYDFEAAEDNELTFTSGEIIFVLDDSDANWWKGSNQRGEGLFPASFVTADLSAEPEKLVETKKKSTVDEEDKTGAKDVEVNEEKIDRLLHLLHEADPTNSSHDTEEMLKLEREVNAMGPLIDTELERVDRKHAQLTQLSSDLVEALSLYHTLMREPPHTAPISKLPYGYQPPHSAHPMNYNGSYPMSMGPSSSLPPGPYGSLPPPMQDGRGFMPPPPHFSGIPQGLPPNVLGQLPHPPQHVQHIPALSGPTQQQPHSMPPQGLLHHPPPPVLDDRIQQPANVTHLPPGMGPPFGPPHMYHHQQQQQQQLPPRPATMPLQNGQGPPGPQSGHFPPTPNTHIM